MYGIYDFSIEVRLFLLSRLNIALNMLISAGLPLGCDSVGSLPNREMIFNSSLRVTENST